MPRMTKQLCKGCIDARKAKRGECPFFGTCDVVLRVQCDQSGTPIAESRWIPACWRSPGVYMVNVEAAPQPDDPDEQLPLPKYIERFIRFQWPQKPQRWSELTDELITAAADGTGCSYSVETAGNLVASRQAGHQPEDLDYFGQPKH